MKKFVAIILLVLLSPLLFSCTNKGEIANLQEMVKKLETENSELKENIQDLNNQMSQTTTTTTDVEETQTTENTQREPIEFNPSVIGNISKYYLQNIYVAGDYAYISADSKLKIIDLTEKSNPIEIGSININAIGDFISKDDILYVPFYKPDDTGGIGSGGIKVIDIENKKAPSEIGSYETEESIIGLNIQGNTLYANFYLHEKVGEESWKVTDSGIELINVSDNTNPVLVGKYSTHDMANIIFYPLEKNIYLVAGSKGSVLDITDKNNINAVGSIPIYTWAISDLIIKDNYLYILEGNAVQILDISIKEKPEIIGGFFIEGSVSKIAIENDYAYVTYYIMNDSQQITESGLQIIDVFDKSSPKIITGLKIEGECSKIFVSGEYAYIAAGSKGIQIVKLY